MAGENVIASVLPLSSKPISSYDNDYLLKLHPGSFPWGKGARPSEGMSLIQYFRLILRRVPLSQFGQNVGLLFTMWDVWQRHEVNRHASIIIQQDASIVGKLNNLTDEEFSEALSVVGKSGSHLIKAMSKLSFKAKEFLSFLKKLGSRILGSPQSKLSLRSKAFAAPIVYGSSTIMMNLSAAEIAAKWVFEMGEPRTPYAFDLYTGEPISQGDSCRPPRMEALRFIAKNFLACQHFFKMYFHAFNDIFLGWPFGAKKQVNPNCIFGVILTILWSYEESGRGGLHGHGPLTVPMFQYKNLQELFKSGRMGRLLLLFAENLASTFMPSAYDDIMPEVCMAFHNICVINKCIFQTSNVLYIFTLPGWVCK